jgi:hypothetical protein
MKYDEALPTKRGLECLITSQKACFCDIWIAQVLLE